MRTSMLIVEFLVGGILISLALLFFVSSVFYGDIREVRNILYQDQLVLLLLSTIFVAVAYAVGLFLETFARGFFEGMLNEIKRKSLVGYIAYLDKEYDVDFSKSPILERAKEKLSEKEGVGNEPSEGGKENRVESHWLMTLLKRKNEDPVREYGLMRFYVLMKSPSLYQDIASHLHRFRLMRISFIAEIILIGAVIVELFREITLPMLVVLGIFILIVCLNVFVIRDRFERYCWAIEKSYRVLVFDQR